MTDGLTLLFMTDGAVEPRNLAERQTTTEKSFMAVTGKVQYVDPLSDAKILIIGSHMSRAIRYLRLHGVGVKKFSPDMIHVREDSNKEGPHKKGLVITGLDDLSIAAVDNREETRHAHMELAMMLAELKYPHKFRTYIKEYRKAYALRDPDEIAKAEKKFKKRCKWRRSFSLREPSLSMTRISRYI